jgi:hypothetical protein
VRSLFLPLAFCAFLTLRVHALDPYSGPASLLVEPVTMRQPLADFKADFKADAPRELRLILREAITLTDIQKQGIKGGGGVQEVAVAVFGNITLLLPLRDGKFDYAESSGEVNYLGVNRIGFKGPLRENPKDPLKFDAGRVTGSVIFPASITEPKRDQPRQVELSLRLDLEVKPETFCYTPDTDASLPPWRSDKSQPSGNKVTGTWKSLEKRTDSNLELEGKIAGPRGCCRLRSTVGTFFPVQAVGLAPGKSGLHVTAFSSPNRVGSDQSQWVVKQLAEPLDLRKFNGVRLEVDSDKAMAGKGWTGPAPVGVAVAVRVKGGSWYSCRTVTPLLGGRQEFVVDFDLFFRGSANPGVGSGPNEKNSLDLSAIDGVAIGVANPFGVGTVEFEAIGLEAVRHAARGAGEAPVEPVVVTVDAGIRDEFNGVANVPKGLFGYHLANPSFQSSDAAPSWFDAPPVNGDGMKLLELCRPGSLRPLDHTNFSAETGAGQIHLFPASIAEKGDAVDGIMTTITNENLWARPRWMDMDPESYAEGIREMFRQVGEMAWTPDKPENTLRRIEFWNEPFMWARQINRGSSTLSAGPGDPGGNRGRRPWDDPTQFTFMPGKLGGEMYSKFFNAAADGLKATNSHVQIGGMSSGSFGDDFCSQITNYVDHFLAGSTGKIDFLTEHHYSGNPARYAADYEIVTAWSLAKYGKSWPVWNTEANDLDDVAPGDKRSAEAAKAFTDRNRCYYNYRDILEMILRSRDVAAGRAIHALWGRGWFKNEGEYLMFRHTADLRGTLLAASADDPKILPVATWRNGRVSLLLLNDSPFPCHIKLALNGIPPAAKLEASGLRINDDQSAFGAVPLASTFQNGKLDLTDPVQPFEIVKLEFAGVPEPGKSLASHRFFSDIVIADVAPGKTLEGKIKLPREALEKAASAKLRIIFRDVQTGEATARLGNVSVKIPATTSDDGQHRVVDLPLDASPKSLAGAWKDGCLPVSLECASASDGFAAYALSLVLTDSP